MSGQIDDHTPRLVTRDDEAQAQRANAAFDAHAGEHGGLFIADIMLAELCWTLARAHRARSARQQQHSIRIARRRACGSGRLRGKGGGAREWNREEECEGARNSCSLVKEPGSASDTSDWRK